MSPRRAGTLVAALAMLAAAPPGAASAAVTATPVADGLDSPVAVAGGPADPHRLYVVERRGTVQLFRDGVRTGAPFLDIAGSVRSGGEQGLLSIAFAPNYPSSGRFYVWYTAPRASDPTGSVLTLDEYTRSTDPDRADPATRRNLLQVDHPRAGNHNGGQLMFGPDGYLYVTVGDGGAGNDPPGNAQNLSSLLGKVLRIDPRTGDPYAIPPGNPFAGPADPGRDEIWAYGLRNPFRASFDRLTGDLTIADVGQSRAEEVDFAPQGSGAGGNYGWRCYEGFERTTNACTGAQLAGAIEPVIEQDRDTGFCAVIGGYVVRDPGLLELDGRYVYGDNCQPRLRSAVLRRPRVAGDKRLGVTVRGLSSFGEDTCGHVYLTSLSGTVARLDGDAPPRPCPEGGADPDPPSVAISRRRVQPALRQRGFVVALRCDEDCGFVASGRMRISGSKARYALRRAARLTAGGRRVRVRLAPSKAGTAALRRALARNRRVSATVTVGARDASGNEATRRVALRAAG